MVENNAAAVKAATRIQALARGNRDRRKVEANLMEMIEAMMSASEKKGTGSPPKEVAQATSAPAPTAALKEQPQPSHDSDDVSESVVEEEIIVLIDVDTEDEDDKDETVIEIVSYDKDETSPRDPSPPRLPAPPPPSPPRPPPKKKSAFERYNEQLKKPLQITAPKKSFGPSKVSPVAIDDKSMPKKETINAPLKTASPKIPRRSFGIGSLKNNPSKSELDDISNHMSSGLDADSNHDSANRMSIPWLGRTPVSSAEPSSRDPSPPPVPVSKSKNPLVNRYLSAAVKLDSSEYERKMAAIQADRKRGRWQGGGPDPRGTVGGDASNPAEAKNWKWRQPKPPRPSPKQFDEGAAIKLQALVRGFLARHRVAKMVDALIEEMMRKMNKEEELEQWEIQEEERKSKKIEEEKERKKREDEERRKFVNEEANRDTTENYFTALRKKQVEEANRLKEEKEALRRQEEEEAKRKKEEEEERRRQEVEEARRKEREEEERRQKEKVELFRREWENYHNRKGLPLWWMERVPHNTLSDRQYELKMKKDKVPTIVEYKPPNGYEKRFSKPLDAVAEEDHDDDTEDENDATLDQILPDNYLEWTPDEESAADAVATAKATTAVAAPEAPKESSTDPKRTKKKQRRSFFSCMWLDSIEDDRANPPTIYDNANDPNAGPYTNKDDDGIVDISDDKDDTESSVPMVDRLPDVEQAPSSPSVTKIVVEHGVTEDVKIVVEQ